VLFEIGLHLLVVNQSVRLLVIQVLDLFLSGTSNQSQALVLRYWPIGVLPLLVDREELFLLPYILYSEKLDIFSRR
jgi:hypothetical protein